MRLSLLQKLENSHEDSLWSVSWAPNSNVLVTGSVDESVKLWQESGDTLQQQHLLSGVTMGAVSVTVDSTGTYGAVNSLDSSISVWNMSTYSPLVPTIQQSPSEGWGIAFIPRTSPEDPIHIAVAGGSSHKIKIIDISQQGKEIFSVDMPANEEKKKNERFVLSIAVSPDGTRLAAGAMDGGVAIFDIASSSLVHRLSGHLKPVRSLAFTADKKHLLTACDDMHINMYDVEGGSLIESFSGHESWVLCVAPHPIDSNVFATGGSDGKIKVWDIGKKSCIQTLNDHDDQVWGLNWKSDGTRLASVSDDRSICLFDFS